MEEAYLEHGERGQFRHYSFDDDFYEIRLGPIGGDALLVRLPMRPGLVQILPDKIGFKGNRVGRSGL